VNIRLSICIASYKRAAFIGATLDSFLADLPDGVEVLVVDGASPDNTGEVLKPYEATYPSFSYFREPKNSGIDGDYDKAVGYAVGEYCWLMTDDDLLRPGAVQRVLDELASDPDLLVVNAEVRTADLSRCLTPAMMKCTGEVEYRSDSISDFFADNGSYLSFIGAVVVRRSVWLSRAREPYIGTLFIHVGTLFQTPLLQSIRVVREPLIVIRYGNAMWTGRGFEIWHFKWPSLIWSFNHLPDWARGAVTRAEPYRSIKRLLLYRAIGGYSQSEYATFVRPQVRWPYRVLARLIAIAPGRIVNACVGLYYWTRLTASPALSVYDLAQSRNSTWVAREVARRKGF